MITLQQVTLAFNTKVVFNEVSATINPRDRIGLVGVNGSGKSTLFKVLLDEQPIDDGAVEKPGWANLGYLPQDGISAKGHTLYEEVEASFGNVRELQQKIEAGEAEMYELDPDSEAYYELIDRIGGWEQKLETLEPQKMRSRIERVLQGLGFALIARARRH